MNLAKTHGIMLKPEMIRAYLKGVKTQTRRIKNLDRVNKNPDEWKFVEMLPEENRAIFQNLEDQRLFYSGILPYGRTGDTLWFKETWKAWEDERTGEDFLLYRADNTKRQPFSANDPSWNLLVGKFDNWQSSMFMPRWASRLLEIPIVNVRVERLHDITEKDARAEGFDDSNSHPIGNAARRWYFDLWDKINGKTMPAKKNPWLFVYEFPKYQGAS